MDEFGFVAAVDRLGENIAVAATDAAYRRLDARSARRSVYRIDKYWADSTDRRNS
jgi:hypothetical protein